jgi:AraC-like DNA-binding protein
MSDAWMREGKSALDSRTDRNRTAGGMTRLAYARAKAAGIALDPLLRRTGLTRQQIENPQNVIRVRDQIKFLNLLAIILEDDLLGFHLAQTSDLRDLGLLYYVFASSEVLIDALQRAERYSSIVNEGVSLKCIDGRALRISFHSVGVSRHLDLHQVECSMSVLVRMCRQLTGLRLVPNRVRLMHHRAHNTEITKFFGVQVEFGATADDITFSADIRRSRAVGADSYLNKLLVSYCEEAISSRPQPRGSFRSSVENVVIPVLPHGKARAAEIARQLGVGERTFARRLAQEGLSFSELLDNLRSDLARRYLADRELSVSQIAWLLGYRDIAAFSHAFKRWTGDTPSKARAKYA